VSNFSMENCFFLAAESVHSGSWIVPSQIFASFWGPTAYHLSSYRLFEPPDPGSRN
jgi:hypothetical protein